MQKVLNLSPRLRQSSFRKKMKQKWTLLDCGVCQHPIMCTLKKHHRRSPSGWANRLACLLLYQLPKTQTLFFWHAEDSAWGPVQAYIKGILHISKKSPDVQEKMIWNGRQVKQGKFFLVSVFITSCSLVLKYFNHFHCSFSMFYKLQPPHLKPKNHDNCVTILPVCV